MAKLRIEITKGEEIRYISHLDYAGTVEKAVRRAHLPAAYSEGFNPHMKIAFASALSLGVVSEAEYLDMELTEALPVESVLNALKAKMPPGIKLKQATYIPQAAPALMAVINWAEYTIKVPYKEGCQEQELLQAIAAFNQEEQVLYVKESPKGRKELDIKAYLPNPIQGYCKDQQLHLALGISITPTGSVKPSQVLNAMVKQYALDVQENDAFICRTGLFVLQGQEKLTPLAVVACSKK